MAETRLKQSQSIVGDGWSPADETWTYASASTITVPSGAASKYQKGDRIKWTQTTVKYGVITAVADTTLTIAVNTDYTVANAAISANYYSHQANPIGYPGWFTLAAPTWTVGEIDNGSGGQPTTTEHEVRVDGNLCITRILGHGTKAGTNWYFSCSNVGPAIANTNSSMTLGACNAGWSGTDHNGVVRYITGVGWFFTFDSDRTIADNQAISVFSSTFSYEI